MRCLYALSALLPGASATAQDFQLSPLFGTGGVVQAEPWDGSASAVAHALRADGSLIVAGTGYWGQPNSYRVTIAAIDTVCGNPQADVGGDGTVVRHFEQRTTCEHLFAAADGKLIGCGTTAPSNGSSGHKPSVFRFHADGSIDPTFNGAGYHKSSFDAVSSGRFWTGMEQPDGKLVCAGLSYPNINGGTYGVGVQRFLPDGTLDNSFNGDGIARIATSGTGYTVVNCGTGLLLPDGKVLVAAVLQSGPDRTIGLARFTSGGTPDPDFGTDGLLITSVACEMMLVETLRRAKALALQGTPLFASPALLRFLSARHDRASFNDPAVLADFLKLDDHDIMGAVKVWCDHPDKVLSQLANDLVHRHNLRIRLQNGPWNEVHIAELREKVAAQLGISTTDAAHFVITGSIVNNAYDPGKDRIELRYKDGTLRDIAEASDNLGIQALARPVTKWYLAWPRWM